MRWEEWVGAIHSGDDTSSTPTLSQFPIPISPTKDYLSSVFFQNLHLSKYKKSSSSSGLCAIFDFRRKKNGGQHLTVVGTNIHSLPFPPFLRLLLTDHGSRRRRSEYRHSRRHVSVSVGCSKVSFLREEGKGVAHSTRAWNGKAEGEGDSNASWALKGGGRLLCCEPDDDDDGRGI